MTLLVGSGHQTGGPPAILDLRHPQSNRRERVSVNDPTNTVKGSYSVPLYAP